MQVVVQQDQTASGNGGTLPGKGKPFLGSWGVLGIPGGFPGRGFPGSMRLPKKAIVLGRPRHLPGKRTFLEGGGGFPGWKAFWRRPYPSWEGYLPGKHPPPSWDGLLPGKPFYLLRKDAFLGRLFLPKLVSFLGRTRPFWEESLPRKVSG